MNLQEMHAFDWHRILFGTSPPEFLLEVVVRTAIVYVILVVILRLLGKRMSGEMSVLELAIILMLGAVISTPMQSVDQGLAYGLMVLCVMLGLHRGMTLWSTRNADVESVTLGKLSILIKDGVLQLETLDRERISREQLFAVLRRENLHHLGELDRVYLEAWGDFSIFKRNEALPGLAIMPEQDEKVHFRYKIPDKGSLVCRNCGSPNTHDYVAECNSCGQNKWQEAVIWDEEKSK